MARTKSFDQTEVLEKIQKLFLARGFNGTSVDDLVNASGLSRSSLYDTFGDKEALFLASLTKYRTDSTQWMVEQIGQSADIKKTIKGIFEYIWQDSLNKKKLGCMMVNTAIELAPHEKKVAKLVDENMRALQQALTDSIAHAQLKNQVSKKYKPETLAAVIVTSINGLRVAEKWGADESTYQDVMKAVLDMM